MQPDSTNPSHTQVKRWRFDPKMPAHLVTHPDGDHVKFEDHQQALLAEEQKRGEVEEERDERRENLAVAVKLAEDQLARSGMPLDRRRTFTLRGALRWLGDWASDEKERADAAEDARAYLVRSRDDCIERLEAAESRLSSVEAAVADALLGEEELYILSEAEEDRVGLLVHGAARDALKPILQLLRDKGTEQGGDGP